MNKSDNEKISELLREQPQMLPAKDGFDAIMDQVHQYKRQRSFRLPAVAAALLAAILLWQWPSKNSQLYELELLTDKISLIEQVVRNEVVKHSAPGSPILEKMISMENWLDQLDQNIAQTDDSNQKLELLHAKLEILDDLVALHKKIKAPVNQQVI